MNRCIKVLYRCIKLCALMHRCIKSLMYRSIQGTKVWCIDRYTTYFDIPIYQKFDVSIDTGVQSLMHRSIQGLKVWCIDRYTTFFDIPMYQKFDVSIDTGVQSLMYRSIQGPKFDASIYTGPPSLMHRWYGKKVWWGALHARRNLVSRIRSASADSAELHIPEKCRCVLQLHLIGKP